MEKKNNSFGQDTVVNAEIGMFNVFGNDVKIDKDFVDGVSKITTTIGNNCTFGNGVTVADYTKIGNNVNVAAAVKIADFVTIGDNVTIETGAIIYPHAIIGNNVTIKADALVLSGAQIGNNVTIGAKATVGEASVIENNTTLPEGFILTFKQHYPATNAPSIH